MILAEPTVTTTPPTTLKRSGSSASKPTSAEEIEEKLKAAEERRLVGGHGGNKELKEGKFLKILSKNSFLLPLVAGSRGKDPAGVDGEGGQDWRGVAQKGRVQLVVY